MGDSCRARRQTVRRVRSGRPRFALHVIAEAEARRHRAFIDAEHALDVGYAAKTRRVNRRPASSQPDTGEQALEIADMLVRSGGVDLVVVDSVAALRPRPRSRARWATSSRPAGPPDEPGAAQAHRQHQAHQHLVIFINQIRMKIGVMFGNPETTTGGNARSSSTPRCAWTSAAPARSRTATKWSAQRNPRQGGQEQGGAAVPFRPTSTSLMAGHFARRRDHRPGRRAQDRREVRRLVRLNGERSARSTDNAREFLRAMPIPPRDREQGPGRSPAVEFARRDPPRRRRVNVRDRMGEPTLCASAMRCRPAANTAR